jgi:hypothetical protein
LRYGSFADMTYHAYSDHIIMSRVAFDALRLFTAVMHSCDHQSKYMI